MYDLTVTPASESGPKAFGPAGLTTADMDTVVQLYDASSINTIMLHWRIWDSAKGEGGALQGKRAQLRQADAWP